ncbi:hypothetical protein, partial [Enterobacter kobei]|uniref:hypothetical protein n=1 Tax=Enterobacter kobei TaxID=208224 RepID=UPI002A82254F
NTDDLLVGKTRLHGDVLMWLMKTLLTSGCTNQLGAGQTQYSGADPLSSELDQTKLSQARNAGKGKRQTG